jgi:hypothetical protein
MLKRLSRIVIFMDVPSRLNLNGFCREPRTFETVDDRRLSTNLDSKRRGSLVHLEWIDRRVSQLHARSASNNRVY